MSETGAKGGTPQLAAGSASGGSAAAVDHTRFASLLGQVDLFAGLERVTLAKLAAQLEPQFYSSGSVIIRQFDPGDAFYLVASGTVGVYSAKGGAEIRVKTLQAGEPFGEMALLTNSTRTATVRAESDCEVLRLERGSFLHLVREQPSVALSIAATLSGRLAAMLNPPSRTERQAIAAPVQPAAKAPAGVARKAAAG